MKKTLVTLSILATVAATSAFGQGEVIFSNTGGAKVSTNSVVGGAATGLVAADTSGTFYYALFASSAASSATPVVGNSGTYAFSINGFSFTGAIATNSAAGRFTTVSAAGDGGTVETGIAAGSAGYFTVIGWSANIGSTYQALETYLADPTFYAWSGESAVGGPLTTGNGGSIGPVGLFGAAPNIPGFTLGLVQPVPEPTTIALAGLGGLSLLAFRRKKA